MPRDRTGAPGFADRHHTAMDRGALSLTGHTAPIARLCTLSLPLTLGLLGPRNREVELVFEVRHVKAR